MEILIGLIIVIVMIFFLGKMFAWIIYCGYWYLVLAYIIAMVVIQTINLKKLNRLKSNNTMLENEERTYNHLLETERKKHEEEMVEYNRRLNVYNDAIKQYDEDCKVALHNNKLQFERELPALEEALSLEKAKLEEAQQAFDSDNTLDWRDKNLVTIDFLIERISRKRANSILEALNQLDAKAESEAREKERKKQEAQRRKEEEEEKRKRDAELVSLRYDFQMREQQRERRENEEKMETQRKLNSIDQSLRELSGRNDD